MLIHKTLARSRVNGPGTRFVVWVQGCSRRCPGCFNPETRATPGSGVDMSIAQLEGLIPSDVGGITVSGGEPFEQPGDLGRLLRVARARGLHTMVYTGFTFEALVSEFDGVVGELVRAALRETDLLIDGPYLEGVPQSNAWAGSGNQRVLRLVDGWIAEETFTDAAERDSGEIVIDETGSILATGIFDSHALLQEGSKS